EDLRELRGDVRDALGHETSAHEPIARGRDAATMEDLGDTFAERGERTDRGHNAASDAHRLHTFATDGAPGCVSRPASVRRGAVGERDETQRILTTPRQGVFDDREALTEPSARSRAADLRCVWRDAKAFGDRRVVQTVDLAQADDVAIQLVEN